MSSAAASSSETSFTKQVGGKTYARLTDDEWEEVESGTDYDELDRLNEAFDSDSEHKQYKRLISVKHRNRNRTMSTPVTDSSPSPTRLDYTLSAPKNKPEVIYISSDDSDDDRVDTSATCGKCWSCNPTWQGSPNFYSCTPPFRGPPSPFGSPPSSPPRSPSPSPPPRDKPQASAKRAALIAAFGSDFSSDDESISPPSPSQSPPPDLSPANADHAVESDESDDETIADMQRKAQKRTADTGSAAIMQKPKRPRRTGPKSITANTIVTFVAKHYTEKNGIYQLGEGIELDAIRKFMRKACTSYSSTTFCIEVDTVFTVGGQKAKTAAQLHKMMVSNRHTPGERGEAMIFFHGTNKEAGMAILEHGFDIRRESRSLHGPGAYATPDVGTAHIYANEKSGYGNKYWMLILIKHAWNIAVAPSGITSFPPDVDCFREPGPNPKIYSFDPAHNTHLTYALVSYTTP